MHDRCYGPNGTASDPSEQHVTKAEKPISSSLTRATKEAEKAVQGRSSIARADDETGPFPR